MDLDTGMAQMRMAVGDDLAGYLVLLRVAEKAGKETR